MSLPPQTPPTNSLPPADDAIDYAEAVLWGEIVAGPDVRNACRRHLEDLATGHERGLVWKADRGERAVNFFRVVLKLNGGDFEGQAFDPLLWQRFILMSLFGWHTEDGYRRFRVAYIETAKGNGKSPFVAGIGHYMLTADGEARAEVYAAATKKDQAMILFRDAVAMVDLSPALSSRLQKFGGAQCYNLTHFASGSFFRAISADDGQSGPRPHCGLVDELHEHKSGIVIDMMRAGTKGRRQALIVEITNSGVDKTSVCFDHHLYSQQVAAGSKQNDTWFGFVCGLDDGDDPLNDESCWIKANPSLGVSVTHKYLREQVAEAKGMPAKESIVRRLNFCQWVDAAKPWIAGHLWMPCEVEAGDDPLAAFRGRDCVGGLDLSARNDLTALAVATRADDGCIDAFVEFWTPGETIYERAGRDRVPYDAWVSQGHMHQTPGRAVDYGFVAKQISDLKEAMNLTRAAFDPWRIDFLKQELDDAAIDIDLIPHGQGFYVAKDSGLWMPHSIELIEGLIFNKKLRVRHNACLRWNVASAVMTADPSNNRKFDKRKANGRIDGIVALTMAVGLLMSCVEEPTGSSITILN